VDALGKVLQRLELVLCYPVREKSAAEEAPKQLLM
jgi:hypothetical protein